MKSTTAGGTELPVKAVVSQSCHRAIESVLSDDAPGLEPASALPAARAAASPACLPAFRPASRPSDFY